MVTFFLIGGGELGTGETLPLDRIFVSLTKKKHPRAFFIATASGDSEAYYEVFKKIYGGLGCITAPIYLTKESVSVAAKAMREADLIYVGGGSTLYLMRVWKKTGFDKILRGLAGRGKNVVLGGLSAGAICWFEGGFGDSVRRKGKNLLVGSKDLGLLSGICCPHYDDPKIKGAFRRYMAHQKSIGVALENLSALEIRGSKMTVHQIGEGRIYFITANKSEVKFEPHNRL